MSQLSKYNIYKIEQFAILIKPPSSFGHIRLSRVWVRACWSQLRVSKHVDILIINC